MRKKGGRILVLVIGMAIVLTVSSAMAKEIILFDKPLNLLGYATQGAVLGVHNSYDTEAGLQSALMNLFLEGDYKIADRLKFYAAGMLTVDWAYQLNSGRDSWEEKGFPKSHDRFNVDDHDWQLLKEMHLTWTPGDFMFRVGKQIVVWGETDGFRLMDQINPLDQRRGFGDVEFESTIIPIWLLRTNYSPKLQSDWLLDLGFEFTFNPNAEFIPNQDILPGNDEGGVWAPNVLIPGPFPRGEAHLGSLIRGVHQPNLWSREGFEYAFRIRANILDTLITLNYFYGLDNSPVTQNVARPPIISLASDGRLIIHPFVEGKYPLFRFVGATLSRDITPLKATFLGGVSPVVRLESFYAFSNTFATTLNRLIKSDEFRAAIGVDWKVKIPFLNPRAFFTISPQFFYRRIIDYPSIANISGVLSSEEISGLKENNYMTSLMIKTSYFNAKLTPSFFWLRDITNQAEFFKVEVTYDYTSNWRGTVGTLLLDGHKKGQGFEVFDNKDQVYFKITYRWG
jgi:hypothetical protein